MLTHFVFNFTGEVKIQIQVDTSQEDLEDEETNKLLFHNTKVGKRKEKSCRIPLTFQDGESYMRYV